MKLNIVKKLYLNATLDSSEAIMFNKGGKHVVELGAGEDWSSFDDIEISIQMERSQQSRFDHVTSEAAKHRAQWDEINKREGVSDIPPPGPIT